MSYWAWLYSSYIDFAVVKQDTLLCKYFSDKQSLWFFVLKAKLVLYKSPSAIASDEGTASHQTMVHMSVVVC